MATKSASPNEKIDKAFDALLKEIAKSGKPGDDGQIQIIPIADRVKVLTAAVAWERTKRNIQDSGDFDPTLLDD